MIKLLSLLFGLTVALSAPVGVGKSETFYGSTAGMAIDWSDPDVYVQDDVTWTTTYRDIYYNNYTEDRYENPYEAPVYSSFRSNACAVDAGGQVLVYYDIFYDDLVPDYKHTYINDMFVYGMQNEGVNTIFDRLYTLMGATENGTTKEKFYNGMKRYASLFGHTVTLTSGMSDANTLNVHYIKSRLRAKEVAVVFMSHFTLVTLSIEAGHTTAMQQRVDIPHAMMVYGFRDMYYLNANNQIIERNLYFYVNANFSLTNLTMVRADTLSAVDDIYMISVT